ncbi:uncharacterized protein N7496_005169 [Penicillium cataractarum]|uniref:HMG box domain-containing protein n=1 Tax=Penicillium cataractarum TaxID=2100454 RepID=A0A9W9SGS6_9EURO|nr:uncharacterized protein N7496_005169 [Penicillium cataractarum]KAJ5377760.1 hypothetical protein N7496_005169 [Penicillium cataractarum]
MASPPESPPGLERIAGMKSMEEILASLGGNFLANLSPKQKALELTWLHGLLNLGNTNNEIIIPENIVRLWGEDFLHSLAGRLESELKKEACIIIDQTIDAYRIGICDSYPKKLPRSAFVYEDKNGNDRMGNDKKINREIRAAIEEGVNVPLASPRVPRPPNSFILYRQHHHHAVTAENPGIPNTEISRIIARMWHREPLAVRARFRALADEKKRLHSEAHPDYQYTPRRPGDKFSRRRGRLHTSSVPFFNQTAAGQVRVKNADENNSGWIDVDGDCIDILDELGLMYGPNALTPLPNLDTSAFNAMVNMQMDQRVALQTVRYHELEGDEFDSDFPMHTMLSLPGA